MTIARGDVLRVALDPTLGSKIKKARPCVVVQRASANQTSPLIIVCPLTDAAGRAGNALNIPIERGIGGTTKDSVVRVNQIRSVDKSRVLKHLGALPGTVMQRVDAGLRLILDL